MPELEAILDKRTPKKVDERSEPELGLQVIVAFHAGKLSGGELLATAFARGLGMTNDELKRAYSPDYDGPGLSQLTNKKLNSLVATRGGRPIVENDKLIFETPKDDGSRDGFEVLDELYEEIPEEIKKRRNLPPSLADYFEKVISTAKDNGAQREQKRAEDAT